MLVLYIIIIGPQLISDMDSKATKQASTFPKHVAFAMQVISLMIKSKFNPVLLTQKAVQPVP